MIRLSIFGAPPFNSIDIKIDIDIKKYFSVLFGAKYIKVTLKIEYSRAVINQPGFG